MFVSIASPKTEVALDISRRVVYMTLDCIEQFIIFIFFLMELQDYLYFFEDGQVLVSLGVIHKDRVVLTQHLVFSLFMLFVELKKGKTFLFGQLNSGLIVRLIPLFYLFK
jgi:hypothetical protein